MWRHITSKGSSLVVRTKQQNAVLVPQTRSFFGLVDVMKGMFEKVFQLPETKKNETLKKSGKKTKQVKKTKKSYERILPTRPSMTFTTGSVARLTNATIWATWGESIVMTTLVRAGFGPTTSDFLPLSVDYREKYHASGKVPGTRSRREMGTSNDEILASRAIDRALRPLFPPSYMNETQILATLQSYDGKSDTVVLAINSASAAVALSDIPCNGILGAARVVMTQAGDFILSPTVNEMKLAKMDVLIAAVGENIMMMEASGAQVDEAVMEKAMSLAHDAAQVVSSQIAELQKQKGQKKITLRETDGAYTAIRKYAMTAGLMQATNNFKNGPTDKLSRQLRERVVAKTLRRNLMNQFPGANKVHIETAVHDVLSTAIRNVLYNGKTKSFGARYDSRKDTQLRPLHMETGLLPSAHGSSLFGRGDTQALCSVTLAPKDMGLKSDGVTEATESLQHAMLHYEFPSYSVNETGRIGGTNRRMIGHGALAEKSILPILPSIEEYPYTIRMTSEVTMSDGSSSMATACGVSMALLDAGVPIKEPVAGISIGCITPGDPYDPSYNWDEYVLLTDILGTEDHFGDMDFKIAGTVNGITGIQLDVKRPVPRKVLIEALLHAKTARLSILNEMVNKMKTVPKKTKAGPSTGSLLIHSSVIGQLIGPAGETINAIRRASECKVSIDDDDFGNKGERTVQIFGNDEAGIAKAKELILQATFRLVKGHVYPFTIDSIGDMGAHVIGPNDSKAFLHISQIQVDKLSNIKTILSVGDTYTATVTHDTWNQVMISLLPHATTIKESTSSRGASKSLSPYPSGSRSPNRTLSNLIAKQVADKSSSNRSLGSRSSDQSRGSSPRSTSRRDETSENASDEVVDAPSVLPHLLVPGQNFTAKLTSYKNGNYNIKGPFGTGMIPTYYSGNENGNPRVGDTIPVEFVSGKNRFMKFTSRLNEPSRDIQVPALDIAHIFGRSRTKASALEKEFNCVIFGGSFDKVRVIASSEEALDAVEASIGDKVEPMQEGKTYTIEVVRCSRDSILVKRSSQVVRISVEKAEDLYAPGTQVTVLCTGMKSSGTPLLSIVNEEEEKEEPVKSRWSFF